MTDISASQSAPRSARFKVPSAYTILFGLIALIAALTWVVPAGQYQMVADQALGREVPIAGTYQVVDSTPQGLVEVLQAPIKGLEDSIGVALFVLVIGGFLGVVTRTGALDAGIEGAITKMQGRETWLIPVIMSLFALGGTTFGMAEETIAFYALLIPIMIRVGFDSLTAVATILLGSSIGCLASTVNPFATVIASNAAQISFTDGLGLRLALLVIGTALCSAYLMRYASRMLKTPEHSLLADKLAEHKQLFLGDQQANTLALTGVRKLILVIFAATFVTMVYGVSQLHWWMTEMAALFLGSALLCGVLYRLEEEELVGAFVDGAKDLLGVALIVGVARGIVIVMDAGNMTHTVLNAAEGLVTGLHEVVFIQAVFLIESLLSFLVPSTSGLAVLTMPILAPLADFANVSREMVVTAYQSASGIVNFITPTSAVVMGALAIGRIPYTTWLRFCAPLLGMLLILLVGMLTLGVML